MQDTHHTVLHIFLVYGALYAAAYKSIVMTYGWHGRAAKTVQALELTHPDAELHVFSSVNLHAFI